MGRSSVLGDYFSQGYQSVPHIIPGVLYPAIKDSGGTVRLLDRTTAHSGNYGTAQSDGRKYYYTDIKGSKPIRDPRIGAHFGSQRHKFKSLQLLEQETATHGKNVYSVDGREWIRAVGDIEIQNAGQGLIFNINDTTTFFEITGYFNQFNWLEYLSESGNARNRWILAVDGTATTTESANQVSVDSPLGGRFVEAVSVRNISTGLTTPRIVTIKMTTNSAADNAWASGCELIAQDTTSTANKSKIQIPSQDVVSYGKKFTISGTPHYDPFNGFTDGTTTFSSVVDVDTSLGLGTATTWGAAWDKGSSNHIRPFNGGRVVKWIDSDGTIKTSVTMMPRNAQNIGTTASNEITTVNSTNTQTINFSDDAVEHSLSEVAKTFHFREFGNGSANGNATYADASMLNSQDDVAYVMDDGLTTLTGKEAAASSNNFSAATHDMEGYLTFIGTGLSFLHNSGTWNHIVQNLPYGTHIAKFNWTNGGKKVIVDGVEVLASNNQVIENEEFTFHQPKRPPIPEHACVIADYMLMADFVAQGQGIGNISKGVRAVAASRDTFYDGASSYSITLEARVPFAYKITSANAGGQTIKLPFFGTDFLVQHYDNRVGTLSNGLGTDGTSTMVSSDGSQGFDGLTKHTGLTLALNEVNNIQADGQNDDEIWMSHIHVATPIHTSHHYTPLETPFLHELIGGDRNMEQTHLICSPDGKTWDEITRNTSYIGKVVVNCSGANSSANAIMIHDEHRGTQETYRDMFNKDFAIAYDRFICLVNGFYHIFTNSYTDTGNRHQGSILVNGTQILTSYNGASGGNGGQAIAYLSRGDYVQVYGYGTNEAAYSHFTIMRVD